eukprot:6192976-Pleurochrysis_carterae.AAC.2
MSFGQQGESSRPIGGTNTLPSDGCSRNQPPNYTTGTCAQIRGLIKCVAAFPSKQLARTSQVARVLATY